MTEIPQIYKIGDRVKIVPFDKISEHWSIDKWEWPEEGIIRSINYDANRVEFEKNRYSFKIEVIQYKITSNFDWSFLCGNS